MISTIRVAYVNRVPASKARESLANILSDVAARGDRVILHRHGKDVAAVISMDDLALLEALEDRYDVESARATLADSDERIPWGKLKKQLGL
jgi:prevent-host-death family protein